MKNKILLTSALLMCSISPTFASIWYCNVNDTQEACTSYEYGHICDWDVSTNTCRPKPCSAITDESRCTEVVDPELGCAWINNACVGKNLIGVNDTSSDSCNTDTLGVSEGEAGIDALWTANTIELKWYSDGTEYTVQDVSKTCTYDGTITLPTTEPTKTGYTFSGWRVRTTK